MAIISVRQNGWPAGPTTLTSAEINQLDQNSVHGLDKRAGETDDLRSNVTVTGGGSITIDSDGELTLNPESVTINDGTLKVLPTLQGDGGPLHLGFESISITGNGGTTVDLTQSSDLEKGILILEGTITEVNGSTTRTVLLPDPKENSAYIKYIINNTDGEVRARAKTNQGFTSGLVAPGRAAAIAVYDNANLNNALNIADSRQNEIFEVWNKSDSNSYGTTVQTISTTSYTKVTGFERVFTGIQVGDIFQIDLSVGVENSASNTSTVAVHVDDGSSSELVETQVQATSTDQVNAFVSTIYVADSTNDLTIDLRGKATAGDCLVKTPVSFMITRITG